MFLFLVNISVNVALIVSQYIVSRMQTFYDALEVGIGCDATDIRDAYKRLALTFHPDKTGSTSVDAGDRFRLINEVPSLV